MAVSATRIAVVDHELFFREAISDILGTAGFACELAEDGHRALELARDESIGVMLLDIRLPGIDSVDVVRKLREMRPELRVLVLSGSADQELVLEALRLGACDYLAKPLHDEELVLAVRRAAEICAIASDADRLRARLGRLAAVAEELSRSAGAMSGADRDAYLNQAGAESVSELLDAEKTSLMLLTDAGDELCVVAAVGRSGGCDAMDRVPIGEGVAGVSFERSQPVLVNSSAGDPQRLGSHVAGRYASDSFVVAPIAAAGQSFGVLCATDRPGGESFGLEDLSLLRLLAGLIGGLMAVGRDVKDPVLAAGADLSAVADASESETSEVESGMDDVDRDSELVRAICDALVNELEPERVIRAVLEPIARELRAAPVALFLLDAAKGLLVREGQLEGAGCADREELPTALGLTGTVFHSGNLVSAQSPDQDARYDPMVDTPVDGQPRPLLCVPLRMRGKVVGLCRVFLPASEIASARTGEVLAAALSAAVRNVLLYRSLLESIEEVAEARREARLSL